YPQLTEETSPTARHRVGGRLRHWKAESDGGRDGGGAGSLPSARPRGSRRCSAQFRRSRWSLPPFWPVVGYGSRKVAPRAERARLAEYGVSDREGDRVTLRLRGELVGEETAEEFKESLDRHYV